MQKNIILDVESLKDIIFLQFLPSNKFKPGKTGVVSLGCNMNDHHIFSFLMKSFGISYQIRINIMNTMYDTLLLMPIINII